MAYFRYLIDVGSKHGTRIGPATSATIEPLRYVQLRHTDKFHIGKSSREFVLLRTVDEPQRMG